MSFVKIILVIAIVVIVLGVSGAILLSLKSKSGSALGLIDGTLAPCPSSPNCVSSERGTPPSHRVEPLDLAVWEELPDVIVRAGGVIITRDKVYIAAEFATPLMRFIDDVEFRKTNDEVHVRSASRVGHSDLGANAKRVEQLRTVLSQ